MFTNMHHFNDTYSSKAFKQVYKPLYNISHMFIHRVLQSVIHGEQIRIYVLKT
jgi:hypothetical protein